MRDPPRWPRAFNLDHTAKLIGIARMHKREITVRRSGEQGRQYDEEGISSREGSSGAGQDWVCDRRPSFSACVRRGRATETSITTALSAENDG